MNDDKGTTLSGTAIAEVADLARRGIAPQVVEIGGYKYCLNYQRNRDGDSSYLQRIDNEPNDVRPLEFATLNGLAGYLATEPESKDAVVHVMSPTSVQAISLLGGQDKNRRRVYAKAEFTAGLFGFTFDQICSIEHLQVALLTCFQPDAGDISELRAFCASVRNVKELGTADDGVSQTVLAKSGIAAVQTTPVKNPWTLAPWRTFPELDQPTSPFVLRFHTGGFSRDMEAGGALRTVADWLRANVTQKVVG
jgi:hypothetical protein